MIDEVGGLIDRLLLRTGCSRQSQFNTFLADLLCDPFGSGSSKPCRIALLTASGEALSNYGFEFSDECDVGFAHGLSSESDIDLVVSQVCLKFRYRDFGAVEHACRECAVNVGLLKYREEVLARTGTT